MAPTPQLDQATKSLTRVQEADPKALSRPEELTGAFNLSAIVAPAERVVTLYRQIAVATLADLPPNYQTVVQQKADNVWSIFESIRNYNVESGNLAQFRQQIIQNLTDAYNDSWNSLAGIVSYSAARSADFKRLESEGRAAVQSLNDRADELLNTVESVKTRAQEALTAAQRAASEQGVVQQAVYFRDEARLHAESAGRWRWATIWVAVSLAVYAVGMIVVYNLGYLKASDSYESAQLITGKLLLFAVISYMLLLSARNFLSHTHNAIVNKHRQNALLTFNALAQAAQDSGAKDIILTHAAACIFAPQETGYARTSSTQESSLAQAMAGLLATKSEGKTT
jgi:hypothetical protein